jgi:intein/homing endonuclease
MFHSCIHIDADVAPIETLITSGDLYVGKPLKGGKGGRVSGWMKIGLRELPDEFRVILHEPFFDKLLRDGKHKIGTWKELAKKLGLTYGSLVDMRNGEIESISVAALKTLAPIAGETLDEIEKNCSYTSKVQSAPIKIPISSTPQLAALVAHALGDGSIGKKHFQVEYKNKNLECIQEVLEAVKSVFDIQVSVAEDKRNIYLVMLPSTIGHILCIAGAIPGNKTKKDFDVPNWIKNGSFEIKRSFLRALFNDEGSVYIGSKSSNIKIFMGKEASKKDSLVKFFESVKQMLMDFGIKSKRIRISREYQVGNQKKVIVGFWITGKRNLRAFAGRIGLCPVKQKKLELAIDSYKNRIWGEEVEDEILRILHTEGPKKTTELNKILKRKGRTSLLKHLHMLKANQDISFSRYSLANGLCGFRWYTKKRVGR